MVFLVSWISIFGKWKYFIYAVIVLRNKQVLVILVKIISENYEVIYEVVSENYEV